MDTLTGKILIAMPGMGDPRFEHSVVVMCAHSDEGAMGLIVNKPADDISLGELLKQLSIATREPASGGKVHFGGPVEHGRGFVLHSPDYDGNSSTLHVSDDFGMTATLDVLEDIASGKGPKRAILALGYAGWGPGQLEDEIAGNGWLTADADAAIVFSDTDTDKWSRALNGLGIDPLTLSAAAGRA